MRKIVYALLTSVGMGFALLLSGSAQATAAASEWPNWSVVFIAHRGGIVPGYPENTMAAFRQAIEFGAEVIEIDLRGTKDGQVVILHDATLERTTSGRGRVRDYTLAEIKELGAGGTERVPTYEEVLELVSGTGIKLLLDIKVCPALDKKKVLRLTEKYRVVLDVIVGVRSLEDLKELRSLNPNIRTLGFISDVEDIKTFAAAGVDIIRLWPRWIQADPRLVKKVHQLGKPVWTTANDAPREELEGLIKYGVNGILSDLPAVMAALLADLRKARGL